MCLSAGDGAVGSLFRPLRPLQPGLPVPGNGSVSGPVLQCCLAIPPGRALPAVLVQAPAEEAPAIPDPLDQVQDEPQPPISLPESEQEEASSGGASRSAWSRGDDRAFWEIREDMVKNVAAFREANPDTVGWL